MEDLDDIDIKAPRYKICLDIKLKQFEQRHSFKLRSRGWLRLQILRLHLSFKASQDTDEGADDDIGGDDFTRALDV